MPDPRAINVLISFDYADLKAAPNPLAIIQGRMDEATDAVAQAFWDRVKQEAN